MKQIFWTGLSRWESWQQGSANRRIFAAMVTVGGLTLLVKVVATAKDMVVAHRFGTGDSLDAFFIAYLLPSFTINVVAGSFNVALIPTYVQVREQEGSEAAQRLFAGVMAWNIGLLLGVSLLIAALGPFILRLLATGFSAEKLVLTRQILYLLLPLLLIGGLTTTWSAVLNAGERFALAAAVPLMTPLMIVTALIIGGKMWGIFALAYGMVVGGACEAVGLTAGLKRQRLSPLPAWHGMNAAMRQVRHQYLPMVAGAFLMSSTTLVDQAMSAMLGRGSVSALNYGNKVVLLIMGIGSTAIGTAALPHFSRMVAQNDLDGVRHTLKTYVRLILLASVPLTLALVLFSEPLVRLLFERGAFTAADSRLVGRVQALYALQIPSYLIGTLLVRLTSAFRQNRALMIISGINLVVDVTLNYALMWRFGVAGIALSSSLVYLFSTILVFLGLLSRVRKRAI